MTSTGVPSSRARSTASAGSATASTLGRTAARAARAHPPEALAHCWTSWRRRPRHVRRGGVGSPRRPCRRGSRRRWPRAAEGAARCSGRPRACGRRPRARRRATRAGRGAARGRARLAGRGTPRRRPRPSAALPPVSTTTRCGAVLAREPLPLRLAEHDGRARAGRRPASRPRSASRVSPRTSVCSSATLVRTTTGASSTFVASKRPPSPASTAATSTPGLRELGQRRCGQHLELGRAEPLGRRADALDRALEVGLRATDADPLGPTRDVRRVVAAGEEPLARERLLDRPRRRSLAVRADDVDGRIRALRVPELLQQGEDPVEPEPVLRPGAQ